MTVMTATKMVRDSYATLFSVTSSGGSTAVTDLVVPGASNLWRASLGGTTIASSSEATVAIPNSDRIGFIASYVSSSGSTGVKTLKLLAGDAWRGDLDDIEIALNSSSDTTASAKRFIIGPVESARFAFTMTTSTAYGPKNSNYVKFSFTNAGTSNGTQSGLVNVVPFLWPSVEYST
jgi:hypothetical protein